MFDESNLERPTASGLELLQRIVPRFVLGSALMGLLSAKLQWWFSTLRTVKSTPPWNPFSGLMVFLCSESPTLGTTPLMLNIVLLFKLP